MFKFIKRRYINCNSKENIKHYSLTRSSHIHQLMKLKKKKKQTENCKQKLTEVLLMRNAPAPRPLH